MAVLNSVWAIRQSNCCNAIRPWILIACPAIGIIRTVIIERQRVVPGGRLAVVAVTEPAEANLVMRRDQQQTSLGCITLPQTLREIILKRVVVGGHVDSPALSSRLEYKRSTIQVVVVWQPICPVYFCGCSNIPSEVHFETSQRKEAEAYNAIRLN